MLRQGHPRIDVGILRTDHFTDNMLRHRRSSTTDGRRIPDEDAYGRLWMRNRENHWWQDLGMQDAGWTYEFFDGSLLLHDEVSFADGLVQPDGPGYQALIVYQSELDPDVAAHLLDWARQGLKVLARARHPRAEAAGQGRCTRATSGRPRGRPGSTDATTSSPPPWPSCSRCPPSPRSTIRPRRSTRCAASASSGGPSSPARTPSVLTHLREDGDLLHLYLYHFLYETGRADRGRGRPARRRGRAPDRRLERGRSARTPVSARTASAPS